jgi:hypothetical protein
MENNALKIRMDNIGNQIKAPPYVSIKPAQFGIPESIIFIRVSLQSQENWPNGYFENSMNVVFCLEVGKLYICGKNYNLPIFPFRKSTVKDDNKVIELINKYLSNFTERG